MNNFNIHLIDLEEPDLVLFSHFRYSDYDILPGFKSFPVA